LGDVLADFRDTHQQVLKILGTLSDDDLFELKRFRGLFGEPPWHLVAHNTFLHYREHIEPLRQWMSGSRQMKEHQAVSE
jgi:hypothetical protein